MAMSLPSTSKGFLVPFHPPHLLQDYEEGVSILFPELRDLIKRLNRLSPLELRLSLDKLGQVLDFDGHEPLTMRQHALLETLYPYLREITTCLRGHYLYEIAFNGIHNNDIFLHARYTALFDDRPPG